MFLSLTLVLVRMRSLRSPQLLFLVKNIIKGLLNNQIIEVPISELSLLYLYVIFISKRHIILYCTNVKCLKIVGAFKTACISAIARQISKGNIFRYKIDVWRVTKYMPNTLL